MSDLRLPACQLVQPNPEHALSRLSELAIHARHQDLLLNHYTIPRLSHRVCVRRKQNRDGAIEFAKELGWPNYKDTKRSSNHSNHDRGDVELAEIDDFSEENITRTIIFYANQTLRTIALRCRDFASRPPPGIEAR